MAHIQVKYLLIKKRKWINITNNNNSKKKKNTSQSLEGWGIVDISRATNQQPQSHAPPFMEAWTQNAASPRSWNYVHQLNRLKNKGERTDIQTEGNEELEKI